MCCILKYGLFITNIIFSLAGLCLLGLGIAVLVTFRDVAMVVPINTNAIPVSLIVIGAMIFLIAFFGCCGAVTENKCFLAVYGVILFLLAAGKVYIAVVVFKALPDIYDIAVDWLGLAFNNFEIREYYHVMEVAFKCCGTTGPDSYLGNLPSTCCSVQDTNDTCSRTEAFEGCNEIVGSFLQSYGTAIAWFVVLAIVIELAIVYFTVTFCQSIRNKRG